MTDDRRMSEKELMQEAIREAMARWPESEEAIIFLGVVSGAFFADLTPEDLEWAKERFAALSEGGRKP